MPAKIRPQPPDDVPIAIREFAGTDLSTAPSFLDPSMLQFSQNWCPADLTFLLSKRRGTAPYLTSATNVRVDRMIAVQSRAGDRYLVFTKSNPTTGFDEVWYSEDDGLETQVVGGTFPTAPNGRRLGLAWVNNAVYAGNGVDPLFEIPLVDPLTANVLAAPTLLNDTGQAIAFVADADSSLPSGTYSYRWAVYDPTSRLYVSVGPVQTGTTPGTSNTVRADFTSPSGALSGSRMYHLFVAPSNQEIEGAHLVTPGGLGLSAHFSLRNEAPIDGVPAPIPSTVTRTGTMLGSHLNRLLVAGDANDLQALYCTDVLEEGLEQAIFNQGTFFPAVGRYRASAPITGFAVGTVSAQPDQPDSPLLVFTATTTTGFFGDLVDDPTLRIRTLSRRIGCVAHGAIAYTTLGPVWPGQQSVYLFAAGLPEPVDVGWPIWPILRAIPRALRPFLEATFHKGFYKLALVVPGAIQLTQQWWLDLRRGIGDVSGAFATAPAWFGPMVGLTVTTFAQSFFDPAEDDRGWTAVDPGPGNDLVEVLLVDQVDSYTDDGVPVQSIFRTARLDDGQPFLRKEVTRVRSVGRVAGATNLTVEIDAFGQSQPTTPMPITRGIMDSVTGAMPIAGTTGADFETGDFEVSDFTSATDAEGEFVPAPKRPRGQAIEIVVSHGDAVQVDLRDMEVLYQPRRGVQ